MSRPRVVDVAMLLSFRLRAAIEQRQHHAAGNRERGGPRGRVNPLGAEQGAKRHGHNRVDEGVRPDGRRRHDTQEPDVRRERDDRSEDDQVGQCRP